MYKDLCFSKTSAENAFFASHFVFGNDRYSSELPPSFDCKYFVSSVLTSLMTESDSKLNPAIVEPQYYRKLENKHTKSFNSQWQSC